MWSQEGSRAQNSSKASTMVFGQTEPHTNAKDRSGRLAVAELSNRKISLKLKVAVGETMREIIQTI
jgi:hypothetical protein